MIVLESTWDNLPDGVLFDFKRYRRYNNRSPVTSKGTSSLKHP